MAFGFSPYAANYQPPMYNGYNNYQYQMNAPQALSQPAQQPNGAIWVQGEAGAKSYIVAANNTVVLWDSEKINSEKPVIYIKSADGQGVPSMQAFELTPLDSAKPTENTEEYITRDEFEAMKEQVHELVVKERERQERYEKKIAKRKENTDNG